MKKQILLIIIVTLLQTFTSFAQTKVYDVPLSDFESFSSTCGATSKYNYARNMQFHWNSTGVGIPTSITVEVNFIINCISTAKGITLNNGNQSALVNVPYNCSCSYPGPYISTWTVDPSNYNEEGLNTININTTGSSEGIDNLPGQPGIYAKVTVNYPPPGPDPEISVKGGSLSIASGNTTPIAANDTEFGTVVSESALDHTFTIRNRGTNDLTLSGTPIVSISGSSAFTIQTQPASATVAGLGSQTFTVRFNPTCTTVGLQTAVVSIASDDADENPYTFTVQGTGLDNINPVAIAKNITVQLDATGSVIVNADQLDDNSTDNCGINNYKITPEISGTVCNVVGEEDYLVLTAPAGSIFNNIVFASFGNSTGTCGNFVSGFCNAANSLSVVSSALLGKNSATIYSSNSTFGDPCNGTQKRLAVEAAYGPSSSSATASITYSCADLGDHDVILYVTDNSGNVSSVNATITVEDTALPTITCAAIASSYNNDAGVCSYTVSDTSLDPVVADNCSVTVSNDFNNSATLSGAIFPLGTTTVIWTATDASGNNATCTYDIVVVDTEKPTITCAVPATSYNNDLGVCGFTVADNSLDSIATDNCSTVSVLNNFNNSATLNGAIFPVGTTNVIWTATDAAGNTETCNYDVVVVDIEAPTISTKNITVQLDATGNATITGNDVDNGSADSCNGALTYTVSPNTFNCSNVGDNTVTLTVTDASGNFDTASATVTIVDKTAPIVLTKNITIQFDALGNASIAAADVDNGSITVCGGALTLSVSPSTFTCANAGANTVTLTATGANGVSSSETAIVTILENVLPIVQTKDIMVELDEAGNVSITANQVNNGSSDNCGIDTITLNKTSFDCTNVGVNTVVLTVVDKSGNTVSANAKVTVANKSGDNDNDGILDNCDPDDDNDGILDAKDNCPITANPYQEDRNHNGLGDACDSEQMNISQAFTPNGDGINDTWVISNIQDYPNSTVRVFNRWGAEVFVARNYQNDWDGHAKGNSSTLPAASSYYYQIDLDGDGTIDRQGWIYINR